MERFYQLDMNVSLSNEKFYQMAAHFLFSRDEDPWVEDVKWAADKQGNTYISAFRFVKQCDLSARSNA